MEPLRCHLSHIPETHIHGVKVQNQYVYQWFIMYKSLIQFSCHKKKYHRKLGLNNKNLFFHSSEGG